MDILRKLKSRKLWLAIAGVATGIAMIFGVDGGEITTVAGAVTTVISTIVYIIVEGRVDAESVKNAIIEVDTATELFKGDENID